jgi:hypothetical protein
MPAPAPAQAQAGKKRQLIPFAMNTRQRRQANQDDNDKTATIGGPPVNFSMDKVGFLSGFIIKVAGTLTLSNTGALADFGAAGLIKNVKVTLLNGNITVVDVSGYHLKLINQMMAQGFANDGGGLYTPSSLVYLAPVASGANTWVQHYFVPLGVNMGSAFDTGIINAQSSQNTINVSVQLANAGADVSTLYTSSSWTVSIENVYYDVPPATTTRWPINQLCRRIQQTENITATGDVKHEIERQGILLQAIGVVRCNSLRSNAVDRMTLRTNNSNYIYVDPASYPAFLYEYNYGKPCPTGVFVLDLFHAQEDPTAGTLRDALNTQLYTKTEYIATITAGTTLGSNASFFDVTEVRLVNLVK